MSQQSDVGLMRQRMREEKEKYKKLLLKRWRQIYRVGAIFRIQGGYRFSEDALNLYEVVGVYGCAYVGVEEAVLTRVRGGSVFRDFDDKCTADLLPVYDEVPMYTDDPSFLRCPRVRGARFSSFIVRGQDIRQRGAVFSFKSYRDPRNGVWETFHDHFLAPGSSDKTIVIARSHERPIVGEFTSTDLPRIDVLAHKPPRFIRIDRHGVYIPKLDLDVF